MESIKPQSFQSGPKIEEMSEVELRISAWLNNHFETKGAKIYEQELKKRGLTPRTNKEARQEWKK